MKNYSFLFWLLAAAMAFYSCSEEDTKEPEPTPDMQVSGNQYQVMTIYLQQMNLDQPEYEGIINGQAVKLTTNTAHELWLPVSPDFAVGWHMLEIPELGLNIQLEVKETLLPGSPSETLAPWMNQIAAFRQDLAGDSENEELYDFLGQYLDEAANYTPQQQNTAALMYKANQFVFDGMFTDLGESRFISGNLQNVIHKFNTAVSQLNVIKLLAEMDYSFSFTKAPIKIKDNRINAVFDVIFGRKLISENLVINNFFGDDLSEPYNPNRLFLVDSQERDFIIKGISRRITWQDIDHESEIIRNTLSSLSRYNSLIGSINSSTLGLADLQQYTITNNELPDQADVPESAFLDIDFSIIGQNLQLLSAQRQPNGELRVKIKIVDPGQANTQGALKFSYDDGINKFEKKIDVKVAPSLAGTWNMTHFDNTIPVGSYAVSWNANCPNIWNYREYESGHITFTDLIFTSVWNSTIVHPNVQYDPVNCVIGVDNPDTTTPDSETTEGLYTFSNNQFFLNDNGELTAVEILDATHIKIGDQTFQKQ